MSVVVVVQARMGSSRLPGKVLMELGGRPMLAFLLERLSSLDMPVVVATSDGVLDDPVAECAAAAGAQVVRGSEMDVLARFGSVLERHRCDHVVRLTADCPLVDPTLVGATVDRHLAIDADYTSNTIIRTHPDGLDVEVIRADVLREAIGAALDPAEREHVTPYVYRRPSRFRLAAVRTPDRWGHLRWTVDTLDDFERVRAMAATSADVGWRSHLADDRPLFDGFEPANNGDVPDASLALDDPGDRVVVQRVDGRIVGWARLIVDDGQLRITGELSEPGSARTRDDLRHLLAQSKQVADADGPLAGLGRPTT